MKGCNIMELKKLSMEDLEQMTYGEITELILTEKNTKMKIVDIFKKICKLLNMSVSFVKLSTNLKIKRACLTLPRKVDFS